MKVNRVEFKELLSTAKYGLAGKEVLEGSTSFYFKDNKVITFNDEVSVSQNVPDLDFEGEVNSKELLGFVSKVRTKELELSVKDGILLLNGGKAKAGITIKLESTLPIDSIGKMGKWKDLPSDVIDGMKFVKHACSTDFTRPVLTCVHVTEDYVEGSDGFRLAYMQNESKLPVTDFLIPAHFVSYVLSLQPTKIAQGDSWVHFKNKSGAVLSCRLFEDEFPDTTAFRKYKGQEIVFPDTILEILDKTLVFNKTDADSTAYAILTISNNKVLIESESDTGWFSEKTRIDYKGDEIQFSVTTTLLQDILKDTKTAKIDGKLLTFLNGNKKYATMLRA